MKKMLVPTDFSSTARKAAVYAAEIARKAGADISLLHISVPLANNIQEPYPWHEEIQLSQSELALNKLQNLRKDLEALYPGISIYTEAVSGSVINSIIEYAENNHFDLIVMGTTGASGLKEVFMGSVAAGTIEKSKIPVLTVPAGYEIKVIDNLLFATAHYEEDIKLLDMIIEIAKLHSSAVHVVVFVENDEALDYITNMKKLNNYFEYLKSAFPGISFKGSVLEGKDFESTIDNYDRNNNVDMIAMITYRKNIIERLFNKSVTKKMAFHSSLPLLAIPV